MPEPLDLGKQSTEYGPAASRSSAPAMIMQQVLLFSSVAYVQQPTMGSSIAMASLVPNRCSMWTIGTPGACRMSTFYGSTILTGKCKKMLDLVLSLVLLLLMLLLATLTRRMEDDDDDDDAAAAAAAADDDNEEEE